MAEAEIREGGERERLPVTRLRGIGPERSALLERLGIRTLADLWSHRPRRYEDRRQLVSIAQLSRDHPALTRGGIAALGVNRYHRGRNSVFEFILEDETGRLHCRWWNQPFLEKVYRAGQEVLVYGQLSSTKPRIIDHPEVEVLEADEEVSVHMQRIVPVYPLTEGLGQRWVRSLMWRSLREYGPGLDMTDEPNAPSPLPSRAEALVHLHFPPELADAERARRRLAWDELLVLQMSLQRRRQNLENRVRAPVCAGNNRLMKCLLPRLGFVLTPAQTRVLREIRQDLAGPAPMRRLLQGDVGSGKTVVAACAVLMTLESGLNAVVMAPTEILVEQHYQQLKRWFEPLGLTVALWTGSTKTARPTGDDAESNPGTAPTVVLGTHALLEQQFAMDRVGLVIIDEQHKFGVMQRELLVRKGAYPHLLVMTATPIPRTLGLTLYGDLDLSVIDQAPPGRGQIRTYLRSTAALPKVWQFVRQQLAEHRQAYVVCARLEEGGASDLKAVRQEHAVLEPLLAPYQVGLLHGQMNAQRKDEVLRKFRDHQLDVLLATTVIEVGLDVPNATILVVQNAERFGLSQLHQLRGRIGRGAQQAYCILVADLKTTGARQRLETLCATTDGFKLAEADLRLRGPGEFLGQQQSGLPPFRFVDLTHDEDLVGQARQQAAQRVRSEAT